MNRCTHVGVYGITENNNSILLIKKAEGPYKDLFCLPGGTIEFCETPDEALVREMLEETGLEVISSEIKKGISFCFEHNATKNGEKEILHHIAFMYMVKCDCSQPIKTCPDGLDSNGAIWLHKDICNLSTLSPLAKTAVELIWKL